MEQGICSSQIGMITPRVPLLAGGFSTPRTPPTQLLLLYQRLELKTALKFILLQGTAHGLWVPIQTLFSVKALVHFPFH